MSPSPLLLLFALLFLLTSQSPPQFTRTPLRTDKLLISPTITRSLAFSPHIGAYPNYTYYNIPMRDGIKLFTVVWLMVPWKKTNDGAPSRHATVYIRSPYPRIEQDVALPWLEQGYAVVQQDMRGMEYSEGTFSFFREAANDSYDTMSWIASQDWSNGVVFSMGISADGINAYTQSLEKPPWLKGQFVIWASGKGYDIPYEFKGGALKEELVYGWLTLILRPTMIDEVLHHERNSAWYPTLINNFQNIRFPAVHWGGWYDIFQQGQIDTFNGYQKESDPQVRGKNYLVISPHGHCFFSIGVEPFPRSETALPIYIAMKIFAEAASSDIKMIEDYVYDKINFYVMAPRSSNADGVGNYWTSLPDWPSFTATKYYFNAQKKLTLTPPIDKGLYHEYIYNPFEPVPTWGGGNLFLTCGPRDQHLIENRNDVIVFKGDVLTQNLAITGRISAVLFVSTNRDDTDFTVKLMDEYPNGQADLILDSIVRLKFRNGTNLSPQAAQSGVIYRVEVDLWSTSWIFPIGHRIRVSISSSNYPKFQANINQYKPIFEWSVWEGVQAKNRIYHNVDSQSYITLPVVNIKDLPKNPDLGIRL